MNRFVFSVIAASFILPSASASAQSWGDVLKQAAPVVDSLSGRKSTGTSTIAGLSTQDLIAGLKEALRVGSEKVVTQVGAADGFNLDQAIHIPLPDQLQQVQGTLRKFGLSSLADDVELRLNRAAEAAAPKTKELFWKAVNAMTFEDAKRIYDGPKDAATQYFRSVTGVDLAAVVRPVVEQSLNEVGALTAYDSLMSQYKNIPFVPDVKGDLTQHAVNKTLDGIFLYLAKEEAAIRENPAARTTDLLKKVFGG